MRATKIKGALVCPGCDEIIDPVEDGAISAEETWTCGECEATGTEGPGDSAGCPTCSTVVMEKCPECEAWQEPVDWEPKAMCPKCEDFFAEDDFAEPDEAYRCGECDTAYQDREEAKECCK